MKIKHTSIKREPWERVISKTQVTLPTESKKGAASLLRFDKITAPMVREYDGQRVEIVSEGAYWLQLGYEGEPYFYTAMFDKNGNFIHVYIDITSGNSCTPPEEAGFDDLFLDIVYAHGKIYVLDRDELDSAQNEGVISKEVADEVLILAEEKIAELEKHGEDLNFELIQLFNKLVKLM